jgi:hypothetical protein
MSFRPNPKLVSEHEVTHDTLGTLVFAKDGNGETTPLRHIGPENAKLNTSDLDVAELLLHVLDQLKITNAHLALITDEEITEQDMEC